MPIKKRTIAGGLLVVGAVLGTFMSGLLPGFGSGSGVDAQVNVNNSVSTATNSPDEAPTISTPTEKPATPEVEATTLEIRVDNHDYFVPDNESATGARKVGLDEVVELAQKTTGNDDGIRVRIARSQSARVTAWTTLHDSLVKAGLTQDSIRMPKDLVE